MSGNQVLYQANRTLPLFEVLVNILRKTSGLVDVLANALTSLAEKIDKAFVFGSLGRGTETSDSDVDVLIIGKIVFSQAVTALYPAQAILRREINPKIYSKKQWQKLFKNKDPFVLELIDKPKFFIIGTPNNIR